jgi:SAM-dependent methyltransferase
MSDISGYWNIVRDCVILGTDTHVLTSTKSDSMNLNWYLPPTRLKRFAKFFVDKPCKVLDIGCANGSYRLIRHWLPKCSYYGLDITEENLTPQERSEVAGFYLADLEKDDLARLPDGFFDVIIVSHVIEHLTNSLDVLGRLCRKLAAGGHIYVEFPSVRSLNLPEAKHTLNFSDDPTHVRIYDVREVANVMFANGLRVVRGGRRREWLRVFLSVGTFPIQLVTYLREGKLHGTGLWDLLGFADFVYARKPADGTNHA